MGLDSHNKRLQTLIEDSDALIDQSESTHDLLQVIGQVRDFGAPLAFNNTTPKVLITLGVLFLLAAILFIPLVLVGIILIVIGWRKISKRNGLLDVLSAKILANCALFTNDLKAVTGLAPITLANFLREFRDFNRGTYQRNIVELVQGVFPGDTHAMPFIYSHFHFVDERTETYSVTDGKGGSTTKTRKVYDHYHRYSLVVDFTWVRDVTVRGNGGGSIDREYDWDSTSVDFNRAFKLTGDSEMACAKFSKPATILHLLHMQNELKSPNFEFSANGRLCLSFDNADLMSCEADGSLKEPAVFYDSIAQGVALPRLFSALALVHKLAELHDDNFNLPKNNRRTQESQ